MSFWEAMLIGLLISGIIGVVLVILFYAMDTALKRKSTIQVPEKWQKAADEVEEAQIAKESPAVKEEPLEHWNASRKFLDVMAELGFPNPLESFLQATAQNQLSWQLSTGAPNEIVFEAKNVIDDISLRCSKSATANIPIYMLIFLDSQRRFADSFYPYIDDFSGEKIVKKYFDWLEEKFKAEINKIPS